MREVKAIAVRYGWLLAVPVLVLACGGAEPEPEPEMESAPPPPSAPAPSNMGPTVSFVSPEDGGTYPADQPVRFEFAIENYDLAAVPEEEADQPRPGVGHHHLGVDTGCLPAGEVIPRGDPSWIHFGDASTTIDMQLEPGEHTMVLQLGDDEHRAQAAEGLCATVTFRVEEGI